MSSICLLVTVLSMDEKIRFLAFFAFELSLGLYFPSIGLLKSQLVDERNRGWIYGLMRLPLNVFVTSVLCTTGEGQVAMQVSDSFANELQTTRTARAVSYYVASF